MSRNLYLGANIDPVLQASSLNGVLVAAANLWATVQASDPPGRMNAVAAEIARAQPDVVGLQEVSLWRIQAPGGNFLGPHGIANPLPDATEVRYDLLALLLADLKALGLGYEPVVVSTNVDVELPIVTIASDGQFVPQMDVRLTDRDVILARAGLHVSDPESGHYAAAVPLRLGGVLELSIFRGWASIAVEHKGATSRFVNTHLEIEELAEGAVQMAQALELVGILEHEPSPVILVGDFNSAPTAPEPSSYGVLRSAGYADLWSETRPTDPGNTCCQADDLRNPASQLSERIDLVLFRGPFAARSAEVFEARTASGLWASDHAVVFGALRPLRGGERFASGEQ